MKKRITNLYVLIHALGDLLILNVAYFLGHVWGFWNYVQMFDTKYLQLWIYLNVIYLFAAQLSGTFDMYRNTRFFTLLSALLKLFFLEVVLSFSYIVVFKDYNQTFKLSREVLMITYITAFIFTMIWRFGFIKIVRIYRARGFNNRKVMIIGAGETAQEFKTMLEHKIEYGYQFLGFYDNNPEKYTENVKKHILGTVEDAKRYAVEHQIDEMFCALPYDDEENIKGLIQFGDENLIRVKIVPDLSRFLTHHLNKVEIDYYGQIPVMTLRSEPLENIVNRFIKRLFDIGFSILVLLFILSWFIPLMAVIIKLTSRGPVFFIQKRSGIKNKSFSVIKFRTMYVNGDAHHRQATRHDQRITPIGKFLRKTNLDELPQFINVFTGQMSVIGPRPHMLKHTEEYSKIIDKFMVRHLIKPGITGWAQVNGYRGETKDVNDMEGRVRADVWYIENWSFGLDVKIIIMTIINMLRGEENAF
ncbi:MAG: undecaprenyl-phosphate glucose phosphotransferase [Sphingobacteriales bacterium]|nr:undecaprenyl-phosphate glucose phosphotransferase [Sphingobacteriales bacterium]